MKKRWFPALLVMLFAVSFAASASAETLSWNAVTQYTDGTSIGSATVTYQAYWTPNSNMTGLNTLGSAGSSTSRTFNVDTSGMPRGSIIYFTCKATVSGVDSSLASALSWNVPTKSPSAPGNLQMN